MRDLASFGREVTMQCRSVVLVGFGLGLVFLSPAFAVATRLDVVPAPPLVTVAASKAETATVKKKLPAKKAKRQLSEKELAAKARAERKKKLEAAARAKAEAKAKLAAKAKAERAKRIAERKQAEAERRLARAKASEERRIARLRADEARRQAIARAAADARRAETSRLMAMEVARTGNNGELRSEVSEPVQSGLFANLFGGAIQTQSMLPETRALDAVLEQKQGSRKFQVKSDFEPQVVSFPGYRRDTIVIDTNSRFLYLVESSSRARRYAIAVGREGLEFKGTGKIGDKQEWPRWIPTLDMQKREPEKYAQYKDGMPGGPDNPLGARAMYVYQGGRDTHIRIHGTNQPQTIGTNSSNGCFRMINEHVMDLYRRVRVGTEVIVM